MFINFILIQFDILYTMNITCMMVLTSVYLSVSSSLPPTPNIKPVEIWLLFNVAYPFLVIVASCLLQVINMSRLIFSNFFLKISEEKFNQPSPVMVREYNDNLTQEITGKKNKTTVIILKIYLKFLNPLVYCILLIYTL